MTGLSPRRGVWAGSVDGLGVVTPPPQIDRTNADRLRRALTAAAAQFPVVVVDMTANELCDSSGIRALVVAHQRARASGGEIQLVMNGPDARRVFKMTGVDLVLAIFGSMPAAVTVKLSAPPRAAASADPSHRGPDHSVAGLHSPVFLIGANPGERMRCLRLGEADRVRRERSERPRHGGRERDTGRRGRRLQAQVVAGAKRICTTFANVAENEPSEADLIYGISVTQLEKNGDSQAQAQAMVRAAVTDFCPQWKVLLRQRWLSGIPEVLFVTRWHPWAGEGRGGGQQWSGERVRKKAWICRTRAGQLTAVLTT